MFMRFRSSLCLVITNLRSSLQSEADTSDKHSSSLTREIHSILQTWRMVFGYAPTRVSVIGNGWEGGRRNACRQSEPSKLDRLGKTSTLLHQKAQRSLLWCYRQFTHPASPRQAYPQIQPCIHKKTSEASWMHFPTLLPANKQP